MRLSSPPPPPPPPPPPFDFRLSILHEQGPTRFPLILIRMNSSFPPTPTRRSSTISTHSVVGGSTFPVTNIDDLRLPSIPFPRQRVRINNHAIGILPSCNSPVLFASPLGYLFPPQFVPMRFNLSCRSRFIPFATLRPAQQHPSANNLRDKASG
ncbi:hypothetical protein BO86DRAFT_131854 [Aspergillus japonicus CBS 114.51]|uniref:Uncharacterized protein n=1 Tax=Aspergillus japonicus CBS 114.51 TaxID=1448312 RepID=A0A8T8WWU7_ASPJA|nr:hypothetical protein BO86DRAFT_131854 [Aspergillus japonicus CBS 114.51]RAH80291.1 hypothetical protein BO86DRAFT_131854 [Aspergillus japonicus CBS 114.51]